MLPAADASLSQMTSPRGSGPALVGVIPAAGHARRLQPIGSSKEMLSVDGRPVVSYLVERMRAARPDAIRLVTRPEKADLITWAEAEGIEVVLSEPPFVTASVLDGLQEVADDAVVLTGFPDTLWEPLDAFERLADEVRLGADVALGLFETTEPQRCDIVECDADGAVTRVVVKPAQPAGTSTWGCFAARAGSLRPMHAWEEPGDYFDAVCGTIVITGTRLEGRYVDIGTRESLARVTGESAA
jgi:NDP-sugar pyrophosphorylase family protein